MTILLDRSPFFEEPSEVAVRGEQLRIRSNQIIIWIRLGIKRITNAEPAGLPFPVILDTGHNHTFSIQERHLSEWGGLRPEALALLRAVRDRGQRIRLRSANLWMHANQRGERDRLSDRAPYLLRALHGIAVYPSESDFPRLPILGLRAISENRLILKVDGRKRHASLRTPTNWWPFS